MPGLKKCYYEVLGIERNAGDDEIKKSFRKLALQLHPDKNPERSEEAKTEFQYLQQAYEVLSNPQERAWYDEHRHAVLRGGLNEDFEDDSIDIFPFCTSSCYKGFGDDEEGFYSVYRNLFAKIAAEEVEAGLENSDDEIPSFGDSLSAYEHDVGPFYAYWEAFCTRKNFAWLDEYDTRHAGCRRVSRLMDKENKKVRTEAKKDWNQKVRALVDFVKRKDKRVQQWKVEQEIKLKEKEAALAKKVAEDKARRQEERKKLLEKIKESDDSPTNGASSSHLKEMENWMAEEFGDQQADESDEDDDLFCEACNKSFRTDKAFQNHEKSKKHLQNVEVLRAILKEEDEEFENSDTEDSEEEAQDSENSAGEPEDHEQEHKDHHDTEEEVKSQIPTEQEVNSPDTHEPRETESEDEDSVLRNLASLKLKEKAPNYTLPNKVEEESESDCDSNIQKSHKTGQISDESSDKPDSRSTNNKKRRRAPKSAKSQQSHPVNQVQENHSTDSKNSFCQKCSKDFDNRTQLFKHLKQFPEHAILKDRPRVECCQDKGNRRKGRGRK